MAGEQDKQVRLSFVVDQASVQRAKQAMGELIAEAQRLAETLKHTNIGGIGGGGGGGGMLGGGVVGSGGQNPQQILAQQNPAQRITSALTDNARALKGIAAAGGEAAKTLSDSIRNSILEQERSIDGLQRKLTSLLGSYNNLKNARVAGAMPGSAVTADMAADPLYQRRVANAQADVADKVEATAAQLSTHHDVREKLQDAQKAIVDPNPPGGGMGGGGGGAAGGAGGAGAMAGLVKGGISAMVVRRVMEQIGGVSGMWGTEGANFAGSIYAGRGQAWGSDYQRAYHGDATEGMKALFMGGHLRGPGMDNYLRLQDQIKSAKGTDALRDIMENSLGLMTGDIGAARKAEWSDIRLENERQKALSKNADMMMSQAGLPTATAISQFQSSIGGNMAFQTGTGMGGSYTRTVGGKTSRVGANEFIANSTNPQYQYNDSTLPLKYKLVNAGIDPAEYAAAASQARASGASGAAGIIAGGMGAGGAWAGLGGLAGQAAIGGNASQFLRGTIGFRGQGFNEAAAMGIGGAVAGGLYGGGYATSGLGALSTFQQGFGATGEDKGIMAGRYAAGGLQAAGGLWGGGIDKYQQSLNFLNAGSAFGTKGFSTQQYLSTIFGQNPELAMDIAAGGKIPEGLRAAGVTKEGVTSYLKMSGESLVGRANMVLGGAEQRAFHTDELAGAGGDIKGLLKSKGLTGRKAKAYISQLATGISIGTGGAMDAAQAEGLLDIEAGLGGGKLHKGGVGRPGGAELDAWKIAKKEELDNIKSMNSAMGTILGSIKATEPAASGFGKAVTDLETSARDVVEIFNWVAESVGKQFGLIKVDADPTAALKVLHDREAKEKAAASGTASERAAREGHSETGDKMYNDANRVLHPGRK
jgi:hypothetical protein